MKLALRFQRMVALTLASGAGAAACSDADPPRSAESPDVSPTFVVDPPPTPPPLVVPAVFREEATFACAPPLPSPLEGLRLAEPVDYVELRTRTFASGELDAGPGVATEQWGVPCATATDRDACVAALGALDAPPHSDFGVSGGWSAAARAEAFLALRSTLAHEPDADVHRVAGVPSAREAAALLDALAPHVVVGFA
ncbi:MAG: hypothetical protein KIT84_04945 [Labilithrix sp.]|nr:hypothetical protein [Labilithrix sp.]MCW5810334.1 hypothetical protein [Labilithrix sp.]